MRHFLFFLLLISTAISELVCTSDKVYVKVIKKCPSSHADEESYKILSNQTIVATSPSFVTNEINVSEFCLPSNEYNQYQIQMEDSYGDSWGINTWIEIQGFYGNIVFKNFMTEDYQEIHPFSLYYAVMNCQEWKVNYGISSISSDWIMFTFDDLDWYTLKMGDPITTEQSSHYLRKTFTGLADMAAYELEMNYKYGIIAYINGKEIFRDNMPDGEVTPTTKATGSYLTFTYHGVIRPGIEIALHTSILAIELHYLSNPLQSLFQFDAYLSIYASSISEDVCYIYPYDTSITSLVGYHPSRIFDFDRASSYSSPSSSFPVTLNMDLLGPSSYINGIRIWPYSNPTKAPSTLEWQSRLNSTSPWITLLSITNALYESKQSKVYRDYFNSNLYKYYRLTNMIPSTQTTLYVYEIQPVICSTILPTSIVFEHSKYSVYVDYESIHIKPIFEEFTDCTVTPSLPNGLLLNSTLCTIEGSFSTSLPATSYTMTSVMNGDTYTGSFIIEALECNGTLVKIVRTYKLNAYYESFAIKDTITQDIVFEVTANSNQVNYKDIAYIVCFTNTKYTIVMSTQLTYWQSSSYLYLYTILSKEEQETLLRIRYDVQLGLPISYTLNTHYEIAVGSQWYYKMGDIPSDWYNTKLRGWNQAAMGTFPASSNQIQLYKTQFNIDSLDNSAGFVLSLRYKYGCVVYMNKHEAFRNGIDGDLTLSTYANNKYETLQYHQVSLPVKTMSIRKSPSLQYIKQGINTIAIAIIALNTNQTISLFDATLRLMGDAVVSRIFDYTISKTNIYGSPTSICDDYHGYTMQCYNCNYNSWTIRFNQDRREWISATIIRLYYTQGNIQIKQFTVKARNKDSEEWTTIKEVTGLIWSLVGQNKKLWFENNKAYNQYRFENIKSGKPTECDWKLGQISFTADYLPNSIPPLVYPANVEIYKDIEMGEVYSNSDYYFDFTITPALPEGISMDPNNGMIAGTATQTKSPILHTITATKFGGGIASITMSFSVSICTGGKGLISLVIQADSYPSENAWKLYEGKGTEGKVLQSVEKLRAASSLNYGDFCVPHAIYTVQLTDSFGDGMSTNAGYYLTVDLGEMVIETGQFPPGPKGDNTVSTLFTSNIPFQIKFDTWKLFNTNVPINSQWTEIEFDDSTWVAKKAIDLGSHIGTTAYLRYDVMIPSIKDYHVLNVRVKYAGGLAIYFNSRLVARFNLEEHFTSSTEALGPHDATLFSKFHIILSTVGAVTGKNVIAFEIHRNAIESKIIFDSTGVFAINPCSVVVDTFSLIEGDFQEAKPEQFFDLKPQTFGYIENTVGSVIYWTFENLEGSKFNSFGIQSTITVTGYGFSIYSRWDPSDEYISAINVLNQTLLTRQRKAWPMNIGIAGFREFKLEIDSAANQIPYIYSFVLQYCQPEGLRTCPGIGDYPSVGEGQISPAPCPEGFRGYSYRICENEKLSDVMNDKCIFKLPEQLKYHQHDYMFVMNTQVTTGKPSNNNIITKFYVQIEKPLPLGLRLDEQTGEISGIPLIMTESQTFTIHGMNPSGETAATINIAIRKGKCLQEGIFDSTPVGETFIYRCRSQGHYVGTQKRACVLGKRDGEWQKPTGHCYPVMTLVWCVCISILIITIAIYIAIRIYKIKVVGEISRLRRRSLTKSLESHASYRSLSM